MSGSLTNSTTKGFIWLSSSRIIQNIFQITVLAILARIIAPESFGVVQVAIVIIGFSNTLSQMGVGSAIIHINHLNTTHLRVSFTLSVVLGIIISLCVYLSSNFLEAFFKMPNLADVIRVISFIFIIESFSVVSSSLLQKKMRLREYSIANLVSYIFGYAFVGVTLGVLQYDVWALVYAYISQALIFSFIIIIMEPHSIIPSLKYDELKELLYFGGGFTLGRIANYCANHGDNIVIGKILGANTLGLYSRAYSLMMQPVNLIGNALDRAIFPAMSRIQEDKDRLTNAYIKGISIISLVSLPSSIFIYLLSDDIVNVILGSNWQSAARPLQILSISLLFRMGYKISDSLTRATGYVYSRAGIQFVYATVVLLAAYLGGINWGLNGVAAGVVIAIIINYLLMSIIAIKILKLRLGKFIKAHVNGIYMAVLVGVITVLNLLVLSYLNYPSAIKLLLCSLINFVIIAPILLQYPKLIIGAQNIWVLKLFKNKINILING